ncbi:hypothetical protein AMK59_6762, partial [Oryctes borbonicus]
MLHLAVHIAKNDFISAGQSQTQGSGSITVQRPTQITLTAPVVPQAPAYHVPRGPAVVANLAAPRSNVATAIRASMVVTQTSPAFVRPPRTPSPAQGTTWLAANASNGSQLKGSSSVLSPPIRAGAIANSNNKQSQIIARSQAVSQNVSSLRPTTTILQSAITIGQGNQIHPFKSSQNATGLQAIGGTVTVAQVVPSRTQTLVYSTGTTHFSSTPKLTIASSVQGQRQASTPRPVAQVTATRLPINVPQSGATRIVTPQAALLTGTRISTVSTSQQTTVIGAQRLISTTQSQGVPLSRLSVSVPNQSQSSGANILTQTRIPALSFPLVAVTSNPQNRTLQAQTAKVITQPGPGAIHLAQMPAATIKSTQNIVTPTTRTINVQSAIVAQRTASVVPPQTIPMAKVFPQQGDGQGVSSTANVFIHAPVTSVPRRPSPGPQNSAPQTSTSIPSTTVSYSIASNAYFFDSTSNYTRPFNQQQTSFSTITQAATQQIRPTNLGIVTNQSMRFNPIMVVDTSRSQPQFTQENVVNEQTHQTTPTATKLTSSPRPSILRKRDHEGSPLKSAKNLQTALSSVLSQPPISPDSAGNGNSSGGSTTISATSSPGPGEVNDDSLPHAPMNIKEEEENRPPLEMSPRKKPRKQQLTGNDIDEHNDDMQFISEASIKKEEESDGNRSDIQREESPEPPNIPAVRKPASASLLNSYRHTWKTTHNHFLRYSDVRPKDERRPTIMDLANQCKVLDKVNGWKIHHLTTQMLDLAEQGETVYNQLEELLKSTESKEESFDNDVNRINELIKGNLQRIKIINEG